MTTNKLLSWDVSDPKDPRNIYKKWPHCDAVYVKVEGCDEIQICGEAANVPTPEATRRTKHIGAEFHEDVDDGSWSVRYLVDGIFHYTDSITTSIRNFASVFQRQQEVDTKALERATINGTRELNIYCGMKTNWNEMIPISEHQLALLGKVDFDTEGGMEEHSKELFNKNINTHYAKNLDILKKGLNETK
jgi:hypothetical protein